MKNVGMKPESYRVATASSELLAPAHCLQLLADGNTEKGDALKTARIAGILAAKRTDELIPLCHPLPIYRADVDFELLVDRVVIRATVETIGPTGVEMEALTAASIAALTIYDMLKPHCEPHELIIQQCKLDLKKGGKSHFKRHLRQPVSAAVLVLSDTVAAGRKPDTAGRSVVETLTEAGFVGEAERAGKRLGDSARGHGAVQGRPADGARAGRVESLEGQARQGRASGHRPGRLPPGRGDPGRHAAQRLPRAGQGRRHLHRIGRRRALGAAGRLRQAPEEGWDRAADAPAWPPPRHHDHRSR